MSTQIEVTPNVYDDRSEEIEEKPLATKIPVPEEIDLDDGRTYDEEPEGEDDPISVPWRDIQVLRAPPAPSDIVYMGSIDVGENDGPILIAPKHRDRLRVHLQAFGNEGTTPPVYLSHRRESADTEASWRLAAGTGTGTIPGDILTLETRDVIFVTTGSGTGTVRVQWAIEMREE